MKIYSYYLLLSAAVISFASEIRKTLVVKKSGITLAIENAKKEGMLKNEPPRHLVETSSKSLEASTIGKAALLQKTPENISTVDIVVASQKLSASGRSTEHIDSPLARMLKLELSNTNT